MLKLKQINRVCLGMAMLILDVLFADTKVEHTKIQASQPVELSEWGKLYFETPAPTDFVEEKRQEMKKRLEDRSIHCLRIYDDAVKQNKGTVLFIHGGPGVRIVMGNQASMEALLPDSRKFFEALAKQGYEIIAPDIRGSSNFGYEKPEDGYDNMRECLAEYGHPYTYDILEVIKHYKLADRKFIGMGHSCGVHWILRTAEEHANELKFDALVLISGVSDICSWEYFNYGETWYRNSPPYFRPNARVFDSGRVPIVAWNGCSELYKYDQALGPTNTEASVSLAWNPIVSRNFFKSYSAISEENLKKLPRETKYFIVHHLEDKITPIDLAVQLGKRLERLNYKVSALFGLHSIRKHPSIDDDELDANFMHRFFKTRNKKDLISRWSYLEPQSQEEKDLFAEISAYFDNKASCDEYREPEFTEAFLGQLQFLLGDKTDKHLCTFTAYSDGISYPKGTWENLTSEISAQPDYKNYYALQLEWLKDNKEAIVQKLANEEVAKLDNHLNELEAYLLGDFLGQFEFADKKAYAESFLAYQKERAEAFKKQIESLGDENTPGAEE